jgi:hypothetical protein
MNRSKILKRMNNNSVQVIARNWISNDDLRECLKIQLSNQGLDFEKECKETEESFEFTNGQFVFKEKRPQQLVAVLNLRSTFFTTNGIRYDMSNVECLNERTIRTKNSVITLI